jgi:hypothetical protein
VDITARMPAPTVSWTAFANAGFLLITPFTISEMKKIQKSTTDHIGKQAFHLEKNFFMIKISDFKYFD